MARHGVNVRGTSKKEARKQEIEGFMYMIVFGGGVLAGIFGFFKALVNMIF